jgi:hypothetical protein
LSWAERLCGRFKLQTRYLCGPSLVQLRLSTYHIDVCLTGPLLLQFRLRAEGPGLPVAGDKHPGSPNHRAPLDAYAGEQTGRFRGPPHAQHALVSPPVPSIFFFHAGNRADQAASSWQVTSCKLPLFPISCFGASTCSRRLAPNFRENYSMCGPIVCFWLFGSGKAFHRVRWSGLLNEAVGQS